MCSEAKTLLRQTLLRPKHRHLPADTGEDLGWHSVCTHCRALGDLERVQLVRLVEKIGGHGGGVHGEHIDALVSHLYI